MVDKMIRPIYVDPWFGLYQEDAREVKGKPLVQSLPGWLLEVMQPGKSYHVQELLELVMEAHQKAEGLPPSPGHHYDMLIDWVDGALYDLSLGCQVQRGEEEGVWRRLDDPPPIPSHAEAKAAPEATAEIGLGEGPECVYGWYLPAYRVLASMKGETRFPMKVGMSTGKPFKRMRDHIGTAPEKPVLGFVWRVTHADLLEKWLHRTLAQRKQYLPDALGEEWFLTTPEELREIVQDMAATMMKEDTPERPRESLSDRPPADRTPTDLSHRRRRPRMV